MSRLYHNEGARLSKNADGDRAPFKNVTAEAHLNGVYIATAAVAGDFDNDGWPDLYLSTGAADYRAIVPKRLLHNIDGVHFEDVSSSAGIAHLQKGSAVAVGDLNADGALDIFQVLGGEFPGDVFPRAVFLNPGNANHWIPLQLVGTKTNRSAIGARISVEVETPHGNRTLHATVSTGGSYGGSTLAQEIGLGDATAIKAIEIIWPTSGLRQHLEDLSLDSRQKVVEPKTR
ncbi:MAG: CRTAC1 family protein [Verrucomicrobiota bacterium]|nr:CRTAC1 family protein [Verrucomicrobiota bacterium]